MPKYGSPAVDLMQIKGMSYMKNLANITLLFVFVFATSDEIYK